MTTAMATRLEPVPVYLHDHPRPCQAAECKVPAKGVVIWLRPGTVEGREICAGHLEALKAEAQRCGGGALFYPLDAAPPLQTVAAWVAGETRRRGAQQQPRFHFYVQTGTGTGTGGLFTNFTYS